MRLDCALLCNADALLMGLQNGLVHCRKQFDGSSKSKTQTYHMAFQSLLGIYPKEVKMSTQKSTCTCTSLVAQWLRIRLPMQGTQVRALAWEGPTCRGATKPVRHNY